MPRNARPEGDRGLPRPRDNHGTRHFFPTIPDPSAIMSGKYARPAYYHVHPQADTIATKAIAMTNGTNVRVCPTCGEPLESQTTEGSDVPALVCPNQHRFYFYSPSRLAEAPTDRPPEDIDQVNAAELLRNPCYRKHLSLLVVQILRRIEEIQRGDHVPSKSCYQVFRFCPRCGSRMAGCATDDDWVIGLRCHKGHRFYYRGGLGFVGPHCAGFSLCEEMPDEAVAHFCRRYVKEGDEYCPFPRAAADAMKKFLRSFRPD